MTGDGRAEVAMQKALALRAHLLQRLLYIIITEFDPVLEHIWEAGHGREAYDLLWREVLAVLSSIYNPETGDWTKTPRDIWEAHLVIDSRLRKFDKERGRE